ncbi:MAG: response regulator [Gammaproteobacteria bacterium]
MTKNLKVGLRGFSEKNTAKLEKIFQAIGHRERTYSIAKLTDQSDLLIVDIDEKTFFDGDNHDDAMLSETPIVTIGKDDKPEGSAYHIKGLLLATRVIRVLDQVKIPGNHRQDLDNCGQATDGECYFTSDAANNDMAKPYAYKVLVVDDSALMRKAIAHELDKASLPLAIEFAETGEQALALTTKKTYDFVFLDVMMPGMDGYETCGQIRKIDAFKKTPIIMLSAKTSPLDEVKGIMSGCTNYITKPIDSDEFQNMLDRIMNWISHYKKQ